VELLIIDTHTTIPKPLSARANKYPIFKKATLHGLLNRMSNLNIDKSIFFNNARTNKLSAEYNDWGANLVRKNPEKLVCYFSVYPLELDKALVEFRRCVQKEEFKGLKLHPKAQNFKMNDPKALQIFHEAEKFDIPVVIHVTSSANEPLSPERARKLQYDRDKSPEGILSASHFLHDVIKIYNSPKIISAHMGGLYDLEIQNSEITFQTAGACTKAIEYAYRTVGAKRVIFGSDFPFFEISDEIEKIINAEIPDQAKEQILGNNAQEMGLLG
jgi:predicted TIM-barrel fold metal-dependent hydrolase